MTDYKQKPDSYWKEKLTPEQYRILRVKGTELPFTGALNTMAKNGVYSCGACGQELFSSTSKYRSHSGWPSFWQVMDTSNIELHDDVSHGMSRVEVACSRCGSHLGHVFEDGQQPSGQSFCINSCALHFNDLNDQKDKNE